MFVEGVGLLTWWLRETELEIELFLRKPTIPAINIRMTPEMRVWLPVLPFELSWQTWILQPTDSQCISLKKSLQKWLGRLKK